jgi:hypothetical protein
MVRRWTHRALIPNRVDQICTLRFSVVVPFRTGSRHMRALFAGMMIVGVAGKMEVEERMAQKSYWEEHSRNLTVEAMMLDSRAADLDKEERPEVIDTSMPFSHFRFSPVFQCSML